MSAPSARILVVDDDPLQRQLIAAMLTGTGYDVDTAGDGREALERVRLGPTSS
ncbi:MAG: response regulator [Acidobacteria bacterium]|nr:response regulator [Acidobacteriota bacterium]